MAKSKAEETIAKGKATKDRIMANSVLAKEEPPKKKALVDLEEDSKGAAPSNEKILEVFKMCEYVKQLDEQIENLQAKMNQLTGHRTKLVETDIPEAMKIMGMKSVTLEDGRIVDIKEEHYGSYTKDNESAVFAWLRKNGHGSIIKNVIAVNFGKGDDAKALELKKILESKKFKDWEQKESIHAGTFKAFVREQLAEGKQLPKQIAIFPKTEAIIKESKNGNQKTSSTGSKNNSSKKDLF